MNWPLFDVLPDGFSFDKRTGSPKTGYYFATNGSIINGGKRILVRAFSPQSELFAEPLKPKPAAISEAEVAPTSTKKSDWRNFDINSAKTVNDLARAKFKEKLLNDILVDLTVCEIEGWNKTEYINELKLLINGINLEE